MRGNSRISSNFAEKISRNTTGSQIQALPPEDGSVRSLVARKRSRPIAKKHAASNPPVATFTRTSEVPVNSHLPPDSTCEARHPTDGTTHGSFPDATISVSLPVRVIEATSCGEVRLPVANVVRMRPRHPAVSYDRSLRRRQRRSGPIAASARHAGSGTAASDPGHPPGSACAPSALPRG